MKVNKILNQTSYSKTNYFKNKKESNKDNGDFETILDKEYDKLGDNDVLNKFSNKQTFRSSTD